MYHKITLSQCLMSKRLACLPLANVSKTLSSIIKIFYEYLRILNQRDDSPKLSFSNMSLTFASYRNKYIKYIL